MYIFNYNPLAQYEFLIINANADKYLFLFNFLKDVILNNIFMFMLLIYFLSKIWINFEIFLKNYDWINLLLPLDIHNFIFVNNIIKENITIPKKYILTVYFVIFTLILYSNFLGLIPFTFTITSSFLNTLTLALIIFLFINIIAIYRIGIINFLHIFAEGDIPKIILPLYILIESSAYMSRVFSLAIRLFANMMAGHTLLKIIIAFTYGILFHIAMTLYVILPTFFIILIIILEILISALQAYVFLVLLSIYFNDAQEK